MCWGKKSGKGLKWGDVEQGFREVVEPMAGEVFWETLHLMALLWLMFLWLMLCVCSRRVPRFSRREMCVLSDSKTTECGSLLVRTDCENKFSVTERVGSLESGVPSEAISYERTRTLRWKQSGCERTHICSNFEHVFQQRSQDQKKNTKNTKKNKIPHDACWMQLYLHSGPDKRSSSSSRCASRCRGDNRQVLARCVLKLH